MNLLCEFLLNGIIAVGFLMRLAAYVLIGMAIGTAVVWVLA